MKPEENIGIKKDKSGFRWPWLLIMFLVIPLMLMGCSMTQVRERAVGWSAAHVQNVEAAQEIAVNLNKAWPTISGAIRGFYQDRYEFELSVRMQNSIESLDKLAICEELPDVVAPCISTAGNEEKVEDYRLGYSLGLHARVSSEVVEQLIQEILGFLEKSAPGLWQTIIGMI